MNSIYKVWESNKLVLSVEFCKSQIGLILINFIETSRDKSRRKTKNSNLLQNYRNYFVENNTHTKVLPILQGRPSNVIHIQKQKKLENLVEWNCSCSIMVLGGLESLFFLLLLFWSKTTQDHHETTAIPLYKIFKFLKHPLHPQTKKHNTHKNTSL